MNCIKTPLENFAPEGVQINELDKKTPCLECNKCTFGYIPHSWRKNCTHCKCDRNSHEVVVEHGAKARLGLVNVNDGLDPRALGYAYIPPGLTSARQVDQYYSTLPATDVPRLGTKGETLRSQRLVKQLPRQDLSLSVCKFVDPQHKNSYLDFLQGRNEVALDVGIAVLAPQNCVCVHCNKSITPQQAVVSAPRLKDCYWHPACFKCVKCNDLLVDLAYCVFDDQVYCERHYADQMKPRCAACDELIFSGEYTKAMNKDWHGQHFCCWQCDESLTGQRYVLRDEHPYCVSCYESVFANSCEKCGRTIGIDSKDLSYKDKHWHEICFLCTTCNDSLVDKQFGSKGDRIYCGRCYDEQFASRCDGCGQIFRAGESKVKHETLEWHDKCFCCNMCKVPVNTHNYAFNEQLVHCIECYNEKYGIHCNKCFKVITVGGITYNKKPWHKECFSCVHCNANLVTVRIANRGDKPFCIGCFGELFAKRCTACSNPITGIDNTRIMSYGGRHWHSTCFSCVTCHTCLEGCGFATDGLDILCAECAKERFKQ